MNLYQFYVDNYQLIYFIYGLFFFQMGFAIIMQIVNFRDITNLKLAKSLWLLALFGITHGFAEWTFLFLPLKMPVYASNALRALEIIQVLLLALSFLSLFYFGIKLLIDLEGVDRNLILIPPLLFSIWLFSWVFFRIINPYQGLTWWMLASEGWIRYLLAFPGALFCSWAFYKQYKILKKINHPFFTNNFKRISVIFICYAVVAGLVVPEADFFPASFLNTDNFFRFFSVPVQMVRATCGMLIAYYVIRGLSVFDYENRKKLELIKRNNMLLEERTRISRDLHDGIIQSIYAVGLNIDNALHLDKQSPNDARKLLEQSIQELDNVTINLREYIMNLRPNNFKQADIIKGFTGFIENFQAHSLIYTELNISDTLNCYLNEEDRNHLYHILQEALSNIAKHSRAVEVQVSLSQTEGNLKLVIKDNGIGFEFNSLSGEGMVKGSKQGLSNILERAELLHGRGIIESTKGTGTIIRIEIPCGGGFIGESTAC